jgi:hypothetical protein
LVCSVEICYGTVKECQNFDIVKNILLFIKTIPSMHTSYDMKVDFNIFTWYINILSLTHYQSKFWSTRVIQQPANLLPKGRKLLLSYFLQKWSKICFQCTCSSTIFTCFAIECFTVGTH